METQIFRCFFCFLDRSWAEVTRWYSAHDEMVGSVAPAQWSWASQFDCMQYEIGVILKRQWNPGKKKIGKNTQNLTINIYIFDIEKVSTTSHHSNSKCAQVYRLSFVECSDKCVYFVCVKLRDKRPKCKRHDMMGRVTSSTYFKLHNFYNSKTCDSINTPRSGASSFTFTSNLNFI